MKTEYGKSKKIKPFLLIQSRPEPEASEDEYQAFLKYMELKKSELQVWHIDADPLPKLNLQNYSGIMVGGSPFCVSDKQKTKNQLRVESELFKLLDEVVEKDFPFFGACYGVGLLTVHQGGKMSYKYGEPVGATKIKLKGGEMDSILIGLPDRFTSFLGHKEACEIMPSSATLLASSDACPVQLMRIKNNVYASQFHPELDFEGLKTRIEIYKNHGYFPAEDAKSLINTNSSVIISYPMLILKNFAKLHVKNQ